MQALTEIAQGISAASFAWYGASCFWSERITSEFSRYGLARLQKFTGALQLSASLGLILGHFYRPLLLLSAGGLTLMMFLAVITRLKIRDPLYAAIPAFTLFSLNLFIVFSAL
ncbi:MAG: DoxX family protein [Acidobacteriaceae bacterium]